jgi:molybdenum cofactor cytidylyltransferase
MIFGQVTVDDALGCVLAHSLAVGHQRLRKGIVLDADHLTALSAAGYDQITVARLEDGDAHEDAAATQLAQALCPDPDAANVTLTPAFTGRVNIIAGTAGVVRLDADRLIVANGIDPMITVATVPDLHQMQQGGLIATVKIISYAVQQAVLDQVCEHVRDAIRLVTPVVKTASLIVTHTDTGAGQKGVEAIRARCDALGVDLVDVIDCQHTEAEIAAALTPIQTDLIMILTGSATSDIHDTAPLAVCQAGGEVARFGIPVDPGNLLFFGSLGDRPVIGLPGCARSIALNGADWVLARTVCGIDITPNDFAAMSVGGLLKEIPTRPHPRKKKRTD